jgi:hypothetical protein
VRDDFAEFVPPRFYGFRGLAIRSPTRHDAQLGESLQLAEDGVDVFAVRPEVEAELDRLFDLLVVAPDRGAVLAGHVEFARDVRGEQIARLRVLGDQPQRLLLPRAADQDRRVGTPQRLR